jgi:hypothetical protein
MRRKMFRKMMMWAVTALLVVALSAPVALAASPSQTFCEDVLGGTFSRDGGEVSCITVVEGKNKNFTDTNTQESNGTLNNDPQFSESDVCAGTGSGKCPPGQFPND